MIMPKMKRSNDDTSSPSLRNSEWNIMLHKVLTIVNSALQRIVFPQNNSNMFDLASARSELYLAAALLDKDSITMKNFGLSITDELSTVKSVVQMLLHLPQLQQFPERDDIVSSIGSQLPSAGLSCTSFGTCDDMVSYEDDSENRIYGVRFCDIVGAHEAKQVLHENVVLPLTLSPAKRQRFLTGIRCGCGNVLLYGPPGTG